MRLCFYLVVWALASVVAGLRAEAPGFDQVKRDTFEAVWGQIDRAYYDGTFGGLDWDAVGERYRKRLTRVESRRELRELLTQMLYELGESHVGILSGEYDELADIPAWKGGDAGLDLCFDGRDLILYRVAEGGAAELAGLGDGDRLVSVGGVKVKRMWREARRSGMAEHLFGYMVRQRALAAFFVKPGETVEVIAVSAEGRQRSCAVQVLPHVGRRTERLGNIGALPLEYSFEEGADGVAVLRFNLWFPAAMREIWEAVGGLSEETKGLVIDLRGNPGGVGLMASGLAGLLVDEQTQLGRTTMREGHINFIGFPQPKRFDGPVAVLIDEASCSTSEVFAIGLQEAGRVRVFGQPSPGAALPSVITKLPNGDFLQYAIGDFRTPGGRSLEGIGVRPDEIVAISPIDLSRGRDSVLDVARDWILLSSTPDAYEN